MTPGVGDMMAVAEANALAVGGGVEAARHKPVGNAAAMREALEFVAHLDDDSYTSYDIAVAIQKARAALSAPARNCDRYTTSGEADRAITEYCSKMAETGECVTSCPYREAEGGCAFGWLLAITGTKGEGAQ